MIFSLGTSGLTISMHYCHGELVSFTVDNPGKNCCDSQCNSCKNEQITYKIHDAFKSINPELKHFVPEQTVLFADIVCSFTSGEFASNHLSLSSFHSPPEINIPLLAKLQSFRC